jgi:hypothetical protein
MNLDTKSGELRTSVPLPILGISVICKKMGKPHVVDGVSTTERKKKKTRE